MRTIIGCMAASAFWLLYTRAARATEIAHSVSTVIFRYVFITSGSPYCSRYFLAARVRSGSLIFTSIRVLQHPRNRGRYQSAQAAAMAADVAGEETRGHGRDFEQNETGNQTEPKETRH